MADESNARDETNPADESNPTDQAATELAVEAPKKRSNVERVIVWGGILVFAVIAFLEWNVRNKFEDSFDLLQAALSKANQADDDFTLEEAKKLLKGNPTALPAKDRGSRDMHAYQWRVLFKTYTVRLEVLAQDGSITSIDNKSDLEDEIGIGRDSEIDQYVRRSEDDDEKNAGTDGDPMMMAGGGGPGPGGGGGGRPGGGGGRPGGGGGGGENRQRRSFEDMDANKDGKLTKDEFSERAQQFFDRIDADKSGDVSEEELKQMRAARSQRGGGNQGGSGGGGGGTSGPGGVQQPSGTDASESENVISDFLKKLDGTIKSGSETRK